MDRTLPTHIAIIMDGNGRWATSKGRPRSFGHLEGLKAAKRVIKALSDRSIPYVTLFAFSTENWRRPQDEVSYLMDLVSSYLLKELPFYRTHGIRITFTGDLNRLPQKVQNALHKSVELTREHSGTTVTLAINYGGRDEIVRAVNTILTDSQREAGQAVTVQEISAALDHPEIPDPDLVIRTAGEMRLSNFLIWQAAYAEYHFSQTLWPDFTNEDIEAALTEYERRVRKFGGLAT